MYYQPDPIWEMFGATSPELFIEKFVVKARFHEAVPEDVKKEYEVAERLMALSFYYYPIYDSALHKLLGIFEMAVKLRCKELEIPLVKTNHNGTKRKETLHVLINKLSGAEFYPDQKRMMEYARALRNDFSHPDKYKLMGTFCQSTLIPLVNTINLIFTPLERYKQGQFLMFTAKESLKIWQNKPLAVNRNGDTTIVFNPRVLDVFCEKGEWILAVSMEPVLKNTKQLIENRQQVRNYLFLFKDVKFRNNSISAYDLNLKARQDLFVTNNTEILKQFEENLSLLNKLDGFGIFNYYDGKDAKILNELRNQIYLNCWVQEQDLLSSDTK